LSEADSHRSRLGNAAAAARSEVGGIAIILAAAIGLLGFLAVTDIVAGGASTTLDHGLMAMLHPNGGSQAIGPAWLAQAALDLTALGSITDLCVIAVLASALLLIAAPLSGVVILNIFKRVFDRPRPPLALHAVVVGNASFPSGHAMLSAVVYLTLGALLAHFAERRGPRASPWSPAWS
jgi:undecaprenyl-diphosphatase